MHSFTRTDGFGPMAGVIKGPDGAIYGTTSQGGAANLGTVFRIDRSTLAFTTLRSFNGADGSMLYSGLLKGADGSLYGTTYAGGPSNLGTLFRISIDGAAFSTLASFSADGVRPDDLSLQQLANGTIYGTTSEGGAHGGGTLFSMNPATGALANKVAFAGPAGVDAGVVAGGDGFLYGTTYTGGAFGMGSVFRFDPTTEAVTTLHDFTGAEGQNPVPGALMRGSDGNLYGTTQLGGYGTVYRLSPTDGAFKTLHAFSGLSGDGRTPLGGLVDGGDGWLYGTTVLGGSGYGAVYRVNPATGAYAVMIRFGGSNGRMPSGNLVWGSDGWLYGTTRVGGATNNGIVYRLSFDTTPPAITSIVPSQAKLSATGRMVPITLSVAVNDNADTAPKCKITGVTANQSITGDWVITADLSVSLRAKRSGGANRVYTIALQCVDASGNAATGSTTVTIVR